ncbi:hypothetical protein ACI2KT_15105 [Ensifer adhaerens]|nr:MULTISPECIES: hypothetical protein [unclassified Ensifer]MBD9558436.1 hypothetical protein [Ensifer sp. ENS03]
MVGDLQEIGIERLEDLKASDAQDLALRINATLGRRHQQQPAFARSKT